MSENNHLSPELEAKQHQLFETALRRCELPAELTPEKVIEAFRFPNHFPSVIHFLRKLSSDPRLTYSTERQGQYLNASESERTIFTLRYSYHEVAQSEPQIETNLPKSKRLFAVCLTHAGEKGSLFASQLYYLMLKVVKPALGFVYDLQPIKGAVEPSLQRNLRKIFLNEPNLNYQQYGDFNLLLNFITTHWQVFETAFFASTDTTTRECLQLVQGQNGIAIPTIETYLRDLNVNGTVIDLESGRLEKKKLHDPNIEAFPRAHASYIVKRFTELFVDLDISNPKSIARTFDLDQPPSTKECQLLQARFAPIEALLLCFMNQQDRPFARSLMGKCHPDLPVKATDYISFSSKEQATAIKDLDVITIETATLREVMTATFQYLERAKIRGLGAPQALLVAWSKLTIQAQKQDTPEHLYKQKADAIEMLMQHAILLISDPAYSEKFGLQAIT